MPPQTPLKTGAWDPEEDELLYHWQGKVGNKWSEIAKHIPGRTGQQCAQRWRHKVNPNIRRDKWTDEEDSHLVDLVKTFGIGKWAEIARHMVGRTDQQCMGRWRRHLDPSIRRDQWSAEEDARLRALYAQYGTSWSRISKALKGRTSQQCRARWHQLDSGRSRRSTGGPVANGVTRSSGQGSAAAGGPSDRASAKQRSRSRRFDDSSDSGDEYEDEGLTESEGGGDGDEREGCGDAAALEVADQPMAPADEGEGEGRQQQQQPAGGPAPPLAPLGIVAASPRRPPRPHAPGSGASTPGRRGGGMPGSPRIDIASPRLLSPLGSTPRGAGAIGYGAADEDPASAGWQQLAQSQGLDAQEAAGAETLLHIASAFRRGSGDLEPPGARVAGAWRRSDFITDNTPTKRSPARRPETRLSDDLSPSPFKKAHSLTGGGGSGEAVAGLGDFQSRLAAADADGDDQAGGQGAPAADVRSGGRRLTAKRSARRGEGAALPFRAADGDRDDDMDDANADPMDGHGGLAPVMFDLGTASAFPLAAEPSPRRAASAPPPGGVGAAAGLLSPPAAARRGFGAGATPPGVRRASGAGAAVLNLLGSPKFEQLAGGCATPTNALAHVQPSPATLALLQSPAGVQLEPLWTPYTGLAKESLLSGTNAGRDASGRDLFSLPAAAVEAAGAPGAEDTSAAAATAPHEGPGAVSGGAEAAAGAEAGSSSHHRVVRRLDQHEAWGGTGSSDGAADGSPSPVRLADAAGAGEASSPPKRARVPLFSDNGGMPKHEPADGGAAPPIRSGGAGKAYEPSRLGPSSAVRGAAVSLSRSPGRLASWRLPPASAMLRSPSGAGGERRRVPVLPAAIEVATVQQQQQQPEPVQQQQQQQPPGTPVQARPVDGQHSTSATPTTPSFQAGCGAGSSPSDYATPQQRLRLAPPTAPLHRDCLIAAAASAAARHAAAGDGDAPSTVSSKAPRAGTAAAVLQAPPEAPPVGPSQVQPVTLCQQQQLQPQLQVGESSPLSEAPPELVQAGAATWDTGMMAMLRGLQRSPLAARSDDGGPGAGTSAPTPACGAGAPLATPCASARPAATPATVLASHLSSATPLALGGGLERATPVVLSTPATVLDFGTPAARAAVVASATITPAASAGPGARHSSGGDSTATAASPKAAWVGVQLALAGKQPPHSQPTGLKSAAAVAAAPSSQAQGSAAVRSRLQALLEGL